MENLTHFSYWQKSKEEVLDFYKTSIFFGLTSKEADFRLEKYGTNELTKKQKRVFLLGFLTKFFNPLTVILLLASFLSLILKETANFSIIAVILILSAFLDFYQEFRAEEATDRLRKRVSLTAKVIREGKESEIPVSQLVPGDIIKLSFGDIVPADLRILEEKNLLVDESILTGESYPVEKTNRVLNLTNFQINKAQNCLFMGTNVVSGEAMAVVAATGESTQLGKIGRFLTEKRPPTDFDKEIQSFSAMITQITVILIGIIFLANFFIRHDFLLSLMFALAIAIGLVPEVLPMILTINLSKGAIRLAQKKVIVKNLSSIQNLGSLQILCLDKTGTLTEGKIEVSSFEDYSGRKNPKLALFSYLIASSLPIKDNPLNEAIARFFKGLKTNGFRVIEEMPFDFYRRRSSVVANSLKGRYLIVQGSPESVLACCSSFEKEGKEIEIGPETEIKISKRFEELSRKGIRTLAVAYKKIEKKKTYTLADEKNLTFLGLMHFQDPVKEGVKEVVDLLKAEGIQLKIFTGDNELVTQNVCQKIGLFGERVLTGEAVDSLTDEKLLPLVLEATIFARLNPVQKERLLLLLKRSGKVVGFLGDGINDAPSLRASDVGISVDNACDIAKEAADLILLKKDLLVLRNGIEEGRKTYANIIKYILLGTSSDFGNMFSLTISSLFLPFLPMLPTQILLNDLLYDVTQLAIPSDNVDRDLLQKPPKWNIAFIRKFMLVFGPISSLFDFLTFGVLLLVFRGSSSLFQTGWFIESIISQSLIVLSIRTSKVPFYRSRPSSLLLSIIMLVVAIGIFLPLTFMGKYFSFSSPPLFFYILLAPITLLYFFTVEQVKGLFFRRVLSPFAENPGRK